MIIVDKLVKLLAIIKVWVNYLMDNNNHKLETKKTILIRIEIDQIVSSHSKKYQVL